MRALQRRRVEAPAASRRATSAARRARRHAFTSTVLGTPHI